MPAERVLLALRDEPWPFALTGRWAGGGAIVGASPRRVLGAGEDPFDALEELPAPGADCEVGGGWFGWLGYGLGARIEALPPRPPRPNPLPDAHLAFYDHVLRQDSEGRWWFEALDEPGGEVLETRLAQLRALLVAAPDPVAPPPTTFTLRAPGAAGHIAAVAECVERIAAGEIFQANLCLRLDAPFDGDLAELFAHAAPVLRPAYGACFLTPWGGIASFSPELFLRRRGRVVTTGPIKGTAPRDADPATLRRSAKDRAEHVMIVDLMRNDLGRVAAYGSVHAAPEPEAQPHPGVWHLVSEVRAELAPGNGDAALLRATFPPGSVTGAPKVQALHVISELEATGREVYTGAIGYASPNAGLELNVAIRTFEARSGRLWLGAGGGIVADSDPEAELEECLVKARPLIAALGGTLNDPEQGLTPFGVALKGSDPLIRPDADLGVFESLLVAGGVPVNLEAHLARLARSVRVLYGEQLPEIELPRADGALRIEYVPGEGVRVKHRPLVARGLPVVLVPYVLLGGLGEHKWLDRRLLDALSAHGTTPLLLDADGSVLEAAWAAVLIRRGGRLYTPKEDGRILPSTSRPEAEQADLWLQDGDEFLLSSSLAGVVPAVLAATSPEPLGDTRRTPSRTAV